MKPNSIRHYSNSILLACALDPVFIVLSDLSSLREYCENVDCEIPCFAV